MLDQQRTTKEKNATEEILHPLVQSFELISICAWCRKVGRGNDQSLLPESFFENNMHYRVTHGICPVCAKKLLADFLLSKGLTQCERARIIESA